MKRDSYQKTKRMVIMAVFIAIIIIQTLVPILGFAKATHSKVITTANSTNFSQVLKLERLGDKRFNIVLVANCRCIFRFRHCEATKISSSTNTILMSQRYIFSSI